MLTNTLAHSAPIPTGSEMKTVKAYDANNNVIFSATAKTDDQVDQLVDYIFSLDNVFRIEVR
jgi:hypothetical protein